MTTKKEDRKVACLHDAVVIGTVTIERGREGAPGMKWVKLDLDLLNTLTVGI